MSELALFVKTLNGRSQSALAFSDVYILNTLLIKTAEILNPHIFPGYEDTSKTMKARIYCRKFTMR